VTTTPGSTLLISYHFNLAFPDGHQPTFVRFDLNEAAFSPQEILDILLHGHLR